ncbi:unnamed protein product [Boreogadus saida]
MPIMNRVCLHNYKGYMNKVGLKKKLSHYLPDYPLPDIRLPEYPSLAKPPPARLSPRFPYRNSKTIFKDIATSTTASFTSIKPLCATRWTVHAPAIRAILSQYNAILSALEEMASAKVTDNTASRANGVLQRLENGNTVLGLLLAQELITKLKGLNLSLQAREKTISGVLKAVDYVLFEDRCYVEPEVVGRTGVTLGFLALRMVLPSVAKVFIAAFSKQSGKDLQSWAKSVKANKNAHMTLESANVSVTKLNALGYCPLLFVGRHGRKGEINGDMDHHIPVIDEVVQEILKKMGKLYEHLLKKDDFYRTTDLPSRRQRPGTNGPFQGHLRALLGLGPSQDSFAPPVPPPWHRVTGTWRVFGADHAAAAMAPSVTCVSCRELPEEGILSRHLYVSPAVDLADAIDLFRASPDYHDGVIDADAVSIDDVFDDSASGVSRSRVSTATAVERERPRRMANLFGEIMGEAAAIKGCLCRPRLSPPYQTICRASAFAPHHLPDGLPSAPCSRLCSTFLVLPKQIVGLTDRVSDCSSQSAAAVNNIAMLSSAMVSLSADREAYGPEEAARWLAVSLFSSAILQLCQPNDSYNITLAV